MGKQLTIIKDYRGQHACQYSWDTKEVDMSEVTQMKKTYICDEKYKEIQEATLVRLEEILSSFM